MNEQTDNERTVRAVIDHITPIVLSIADYLREDPATSNVILRDGIERAIRNQWPSVQKMIDGGLDAAGDAVLEVAAIMLSEKDVVSGQKAASMVRRLKSTKDVKP